jgi:guanylate kinase
MSSRPECMCVRLDAAAPAAVAAVDRRGLLLVVSGPSGVGKGALIREVLKRRPEVSRSVSCTTREPRPLERDGVDYSFMAQEEFERMADAGQLLEWAFVHGDVYYGTPRQPVDEAMAAGRSMILEIDYQGAESVRRALGEAAVLVFVAPPSWEALLQRLRGRNTETPESLAKRTASARVEFARMSQFQYLVVNDDMALAATELEAILTAEEARLERCDWRGLQERLLREAAAGDGG